MKETETGTEELILKSASKIFKQKGYSGTSVQDIAAEAGTTKSMVNYYFRSKEKLFSAIFHEEFKSLFATIAFHVNSDMKLKEKIEKIVEIDTERLMQFPELPAFVLSEINRHPDIVFKDLANIPVKQMIAVLNKQIEQEAKSGNIRVVKAEHLIINIQALTIFPFMAKPMVMRVFGLSEKSFKEMLQGRKQEVVEIIWNYLRL